MHGFVRQRLFVPCAIDELVLMLQNDTRSYPLIFFQTENENEIINNRMSKRISSLGMMQ